MPIINDLVIHLLKKEPLLNKARKIFDFLFDLLVICPYYTIFRPSALFTLRQQSYRYFLSSYNFTWENERIVEVPIILKLIEESHGEKILEVGNVLSHYVSIKHDVVDKYEKSDGVINSDIVDFMPAYKYDLIVSISTFEHIGFDESLKDPNKLLDAFRNVRNILAPGGKAVITLPVGYNPGLDKLLREDRTIFADKYCLKRISRLNSWTEVDWDAIRDAEFDRPFRFANGLVFAVIKS